MSKRAKVIVGIVLFGLMLIGFFKSKDEKVAQKPQEKPAKAEMSFKGFDVENYSPLERGLIFKNSNQTDLALRALCKIERTSPDYDAAQKAAGELNFTDCKYETHDLGVVSGGIDANLAKAMRMLYEDAYGKKGIGWTTVNFKIFDENKELWEFTLKYEKITSQLWAGLVEPCLRKGTCLQKRGGGPQGLVGEELLENYSYKTCPMSGWLSREECFHGGRDVTGSKVRRRGKRGEFDKVHGIK